MRESPGKALPPFSSKDIATFVSKQNNKTSQPVVVNFLFASIDSISFFFPLGDSSRYSTGESRGEKRGGNRERKKRKRQSASGRKAIEDLIPTKPWKKLI